MRTWLFPAGTLLCAGLLAGCTSEGGEAAAGDDTTAALLAQPVGNGMSTPIPIDRAGGGDTPPVAVEELGFDRGDAAAIVKVVEMSDFGCGFCRRFHDETFPTLREEFIETGMVEWKFLPYITGMFANSLAATEAGECVMEQDVEAYEAITRRLWSEQSEWKGASQPEPVLRGWVEELGIDMDGFDGCLAEDRRLDRIASATTLARQIGVRGTPTFVIIGYPPLQGALPLDVFQDILTAVHAEEARNRQGPPEQPEN